MFAKLLPLSAVTLALLACSSTKEMPVVQRQPGSFTSLTFPVFSEQWGDGKVQLATNDGKGCGEFSANILPAIPDKDFTLDIDGGHDIFFHVSRADGKTQCDEFGLFYATKGNEYTLSLKAKDQKCVISLIEKTPRGTQSRINTYSAYASAVDGIKVCVNKDKLY